MNNICRRAWEGGQLLPFHVRGKTENKQLFTDEHVTELLEATYA